MEIKLKGYRRCNLYVGGDRRDKSLQTYIESTPQKMFLIKKSGADFEIWGADEVEPVIEANNKPKITKRSKKKKTSGAT